MKIIELPSELFTSLNPLFSLKAVFDCISDIVIILNGKGQIADLNYKAKEYYACDQSAKGRDYNEFCMESNQEIILSFPKKAGSTPNVGAL